MHPIERLRYVARSGDGDPRLLVHETAAALRGLRLDPAGLVVACRRIVERHPSCAPLWWLCAHLLSAPDPFACLSELAERVEDDPTAAVLASELPDAATVCVIGWPDLVTEALVRRGDLRVLAIDAFGEGAGLARHLERVDVEVELVASEGAGAATAAADLAVLEAVAVGPDTVLARTGSRAVAAVASCDEIPVWLIVGRARRLPEPLWTGMLQRLADADEPWEHSVEPVPLALVSHVVGPDGVTSVDRADLAPECPPATELLLTGAW